MPGFRRPGGQVWDNELVTRMRVLHAPRGIALWGEGSLVQFDSEEVVGSAGLLPTIFKGAAPGSPIEQTTSADTDPIFTVGGVNVRRATGRNAPSVINAVFNFRNFWDGRAQNEFNGVDPFGMRDTAARVAEVVKGKGQLVSLTADCSLVNGIQRA